MVDGTTAAMAPSAVSLASTFDTKVISGIGELLATEVKDKKSDILLAPTGMCFSSFPDRSPLRRRMLTISAPRSVSPPLSPRWPQLRILLRR